MKIERRVSLGEHEFYCCGAKVLIKDDEVKVLTEPRISYCPLHEAIYGTKTLDREAVKRTAEIKIKDLGFCCENRIFDESSVVPYGSSEIISVCMKKGLLDCAVTVCDGAGTVIADNAGLVQAIGARLTGIIRTSPIRSSIAYIKANGGCVLDEGSAKIDQAEGERFHSAVKERCKVMRGFSRYQSASLIMDGWTVYYNYIRHHTALGGSTPAEAAGINIKLGRNRWQTLILRNN
jgi:putative methanogenesis marker protein 8